MRWRDRWGAAEFGPTDDVASDLNSEIYFSVMVEGIVDQVFAPLPPDCECREPALGPWNELKLFYPCLTCSGMIGRNHHLRKN